MRKIIAFCLIITLGLFFASRQMRGQTRLAFSKIAPFGTRVPLPTEALGEGAATTAAKNERMDQMSPWQAEKMLRRAYFDVSWSHVHPRTVLAVAELEEGLKSADDPVRRKAAAFVENLLVRIAHDDTTVDPAYGHELRVLVRIYKERAPDQIAKMNQAFPQSKTLAYLRAF